MYQLNQLETEIVDVIVVARDEDVVVWTHSLLDADEGVVPLPMPAPSDETPAVSTRRLVRPRDVSETPDKKKLD